MKKPVRVWISRDRKVNKETWMWERKPVFEKEFGEYAGDCPNDPTRDGQVMELRRIENLLRIGECALFEIRRVGGKK